jgi:hypothetical protein
MAHPDSSCDPGTDARASLGPSAGVGEAGDGVEALAGFTAIIDRYGRSTDPEVQETVWRARGGRARECYVLEDWGAAAHDAGVVLERSTGRVDDETMAAGVSIIKCVALLSLKRFAEAAAAADELLAQLGDPTDPQLRDRAASALDTKLRAAEAMGNERVASVRGRR